MSAHVDVLDGEGQLLHSDELPQSGIVVGLRMEDDGSLSVPKGSDSSAVWTYNYSPIWEEIGWSPWKWFNEEGDQIPITPNVREMLAGVLRRIRALSDWKRDRLDPLHPFP